MTNKPPVEVVAAAALVSALKRLKKKYPHVTDDLETLIRQLQAGETPGDQIPRIGYTVFKVRLANTDAQRGKRGGYRAIYYLKTTSYILLLYMYSKSEQEDMPPDEIRRLIEEETPPTD